MTEGLFLCLLLCLLVLFVSSFLCDLFSFGNEGGGGEWGGGGGGGGN